MACMIERAVAEKAPVVILGDFNTDWIKFGPSARSLNSIMNNYGLQQLVTQSTRITQHSETLIDLMFVCDTMVRDLINVGSLEMGWSDHSLIHGTFAGPSDEKNESVRMIRSFNKCNVDAIVADLQRAPWQVMETFESIDDKWDYWKSLFFSIIDAHIPLKKARVRKKSLPWITRDIRALMRARNYHCCKAKKTGKEDDWQQYKKLKRLVTVSLRREKLSYFQALSGQTGNNNSKKVWRELSRLLGSKRRCLIESLSINGEAITCKQRIAEKFNEYFSNTATTFNSPSTSDNFVDALQYVSSQRSHFTFSTVDDDDVLGLLNTLDPNKATGSDRISGKLLRISARGICHSLSLLFNSSLKTGEFSSEWKEALVTPVYKKGEKEIVCNYRPISILPVVAKVFERIVHTQLYTYFQENNLLHPAQCGFRSGHSTQDVLVSLVEQCRKALDNDYIVGTIFMDLTKAFDMVDHSILLSKMRSYGVSETELKWFCSYLHRRMQRVCVGGELSNSVAMEKGVPQGSILGPLLFLVYVNDLPNTIVHSSTRQYADDTTLVLVSKNREDLERCLEEDLLAMNKWTEANKLTNPNPNVQKTQLMVLARNRRQKEADQVDIKLEGRKLERSTLVKCLGVIFDDKLKFTEHIKAVKRRACAGLTKLRMLQHSLPPNIKTKLYNAIVLPHLDYCSVIWMECARSLRLELQKLQNYGMRIILNAPPRSSSEELRERLG